MSDAETIMLAPSTFIVTERVKKLSLHHSRLLTAAKHKIRITVVGYHDCVGLSIQSGQDLIVNQALNWVAPINNVTYEGLLQIVRRGHQLGQRSVR